MPFWIYILRCSDGSFYTDHTDNLDYRIAQHRTGETGGYTVSRLPIELVFSQECATREEALAAERKLKGWSRAKKKAMIRGDWSEVTRLARGKNRNQK
ncbi:MAG TPA: GIY-YIG nuclease family protein [Burkholderiales bacterium]